MFLLVNWLIMIKKKAPPPFFFKLYHHPHFFPQRKHVTADDGHSYQKTFNCFLSAALIWFPCIRGDCTPSTEVSEVCSALSWLFFLNSVHLVPLLTRSCRRSKVLAGPRSGWKWSSAGYGSLRRSVATVWRFCGLASPTAVTPLKSTAPTLSYLGLFLLLMELGGCWVGRTPLPLLALWWFLTCGGRMLSQGRGRFSRA